MAEDEFPEVALHFHPQSFESEGHFAGPDESRLEAFVECANDPGSDVVWFARGGYGSNRILSAVMPSLSPAAGTKTYLGFSDMGFLLGALYARRIGRAVHGPMASNVSAASQGGPVGRALGWLVEKDRRVLEPTLG